MSRIIIVDPDFEHGGGHNLTANSIIASNAAREVIIASPVTLPEQVQVRGAAIRRLFPCNSYSATNPRQSSFDWLGNVVRSIFPGILQVPDASHAVQYRRVLKQLFEELEIASDDSVVVHTGSEVLLAALLDTIEALPQTRQPLLHYRQVRPVADLEAAQSLHVRLAHRVSRNKAFIYSETDAFRRLLCTLGHAESSIDMLELVDCSHPLEKQRLPDNFVTVAVLGTVRLEKGHDRLADIANDYAQIAASIDAPKLRYLIHAAHIKNRKLFERMRRSLDAAKVHYELADAGLGENAHWHCLADCHVVLMPYEAAQYHNRGSGVAIDAIISARPLLITGGCTLEEYVRGHNGLVASSNRDFAQALLKIVQNYRSYADGAEDLALHVRTAQGNAPFYKRLKRH